jgi:hypothetical protein
MNYSAVCLAAGLVAVSGAAFAEPAKISGTVTDVFGPRFVVETSTGKVLVDIGPKGADKVVIKRGETIAIEGDRNKHSQLRAHRVTMADGQAYEVDKRSKSWREWIMGKPAADSMGSFDAAEARKFAADKGYQVSGNPVATKKHFRVMAAKDGKNYELRIHRNGKVEQNLAFGASEAKQLATDKGYQVTADPVPMKKHFRAAATKDGKSYDIDLHRDGRIVATATAGQAPSR